MKSKLFIIISLVLNFSIVAMQEEFEQKSAALTSLYGTSPNDVVWGPQLWRVGVKGKNAKPIVFVVAGSRKEAADKVQAILQENEPEDKFPGNKRKREYNISSPGGSLNKRIISGQWEIDIVPID